MQSVHHVLYAGSEVVNAQEVAVRACSEVAVKAAVSRLVHDGKPPHVTHASLLLCL